MASRQPSDKDVPDTQSVLRELADMERRHRARLLLIIPTALAIYVALNVFAGQYLRAALYLPTALGLPLVIARYPLYTRNSTLDVIGILLVMYAALIPTLTNGGFLDPRAGVSMAVAVIICFVSFGSRASRLILGLFALLVLATVALSQAGLLQALQVTERNMLLLNITVPMNLTLIGIALYWRMQYDDHMSSLLTGEYGKALEAKHRESRMLSDVAQDLIKPLDIIMRKLHEIAQNADDPKDAERSATAIVNAMHLQWTVNNVLDLKSNENGDLHIEPRSTDMLGNAEQSNATWRALARQRGIAFETGSSGAAMPRFMIIDYARLSMVMHHLISEAIKATSKGRVSVEGHYASQELSITVACSCSKEALSDKETELLFDLDGNVAADVGGTFVASARELITAMGGQLSVGTNKQGETFVVVTVPAPTDGPREALWRAGKIPLKRAAAEDQDTGVDLNDMSVLCIDFDAVSLGLLRRTLSRSGAEVHPAHSIDEALSTLAHTPIDLVLADMNMPKSASESLRELLQHARPPLPALALTDNIERVNVARLRAQGFDEVVKKPFDPFNLSASIMRVITEQRGKSGSNAAPQRAADAE